MIRWKQGWTGWLPMAVLAGWLAGPDAAPAATFSLDYRADGESAGFSLPLGGSEVRFAKEPEYVGKKIVRSALYVAPGKQAFIGFACDSEGDTLYLDLNRNLDLTDDPEGVIRADGEGWGSSFENVAIPIEQDGRRRDMVADFRIRGDRWGRYEVKSSWESPSVVLGDQMFRVAVVDDGDGVLTAADPLWLEPIDEFRDEGDDRDKVELKAPATLVLDGVSHVLTYALDEEWKTLALSIEPGEAPLVGVELAGQGVERLAMQDGASAAVFFGPGAAIQVPAGHYHSEVRVRIGDGPRASSWEARRVSLRVRDDGQPVSWRVGGPIVSALTHSMAGNRISFKQATTGAGGEAYSLASSSGGALGKPKVRIQQDGEVIHVGEFEYG